MSVFGIKCDNFGTLDRDYVFYEETTLSIRTGTSSWRSINTYECLPRNYLAVGHTRLWITRIPKIWTIRSENWRKLRKTRPHAKDALLRIERGDKRRRRREPCIRRNRVRCNDLMPWLIYSTTVTIKWWKTDYWFASVMWFGRHRHKFYLNFWNE